MNEAGRESGLWQKRRNRKGEKVKNDEEIKKRQSSYGKKTKNIVYFIEKT